MRTYLHKLFNRHLFLGFFSGLLQNLHEIFLIKFKVKVNMKLGNPSKNMF